MAAACGALGFGVMNLLMAATPLAMQQCSLPFSDVALVLEWHVIGMFAPGFFTGHLIKRFGVLPIMGVGVLLNNEMADFTADVNSPNPFGLPQSEKNLPEPGKRPLSSMTPTILLDADGKVQAVLGSPGGPKIRV